MSLAVQVMGYSHTAHEADWLDLLYVFNTHTRQHMHANLHASRFAYMPHAPCKPTLDTYAAFEPTTHTLQRRNLRTVRNRHTRMHGHTKPLLVWRVVP
jgi:hypothetical protein